MEWMDRSKENGGDEGVISRSIEASAAAIGVSRYTMTRILNSGDLPYAQVRRRIVILDSDLRAYVARKRKTNGGREAA
jgi:hypothetical protein